jgi:hypothetical protein
MAQVLIAISESVHGPEIVYLTSAVIFALNSVKCIEQTCGVISGALPLLLDSECNTAQEGDKEDGLGNPPVPG